MMMMMMVVVVIIAIALSTSCLIHLDSKRSSPAVAF